MGKASRGKREGEEGSRRDRVEAMRAEDAKAQRRRNLLWVVVGVVVVSLIAGFTYFGMNRASPREKLAADVTTYPEAQATHTKDPVSYPQSPPVGGNHDPTWLNCGIYDQAVRNENAVHSMEHGAVWITYDPALSAADVQKLRDLMPDSYIVLSPYPGLDAPVVASAWGVQLKLDGVDDSRLKTFIDVYRQGSQTPEPGAACTGGTGNPIS
jgi:Protein of unknown function (DUF3105)